jgi:vesicle coat complex subunit
MALEFKIVIRRQGQSEIRSAVSTMEEAKKRVGEAQKQPGFLSASIYSNSDVTESSPLFESGPLHG